MWNSHHTIYSNLYLYTLQKELVGLSIDAKTIINFDICCAVFAAKCISVEHAAASMLTPKAIIFLNSFKPFFDHK